ncbi:hydro-lyase, Fe-S type, tartrate/fumarate subfamily [Desulfoscipio gibsoniae DSM 7213]|uniref:Hydro-lyase, Fe-S type, tartrate/fumarate subfamily n=1 Tax=Desulfoscipio gibsoniae DSM 7213 TaxID=767817 RepID=R4KIE3_9FIRM|nr:hydro-lyase, Fe-S type, tartrate/fumarate subfamily [Desulfoscipio gibsoniae DSM 7213]
MANISQAVAKLCMDANYFLGQDMIDALQGAYDQEISLTGKEIIQQIIDNAGIAKSEEVPMCQDTGFAVVFVELGQDVHIEGGSLEDAINEGVRRGYTDGYLRKSIVGHPLERVNTGDNTPAVVHLKLVPGDKLKIIVAPKGGGSENMSAIKMLKPAEGVEGVKQFVLDTVMAAGPNPCPPIVVGVGIGGTFEKAALLSKESLLRAVGTPNPRPEIAELEKELFDSINNLGVGPQGLGGRITALAVHVNIYPAHIASLPVAVNINCHASRHKEVIL